MYKYYLLDAWNQLHIVTNILSAVTLAIQASSFDSDGKTTVILSAIVMPLLACEILFFLGGLESTGPLIRMIIKIIHGIKGLIIIFIIMIVSFAGSYTVLFQIDPVEGYDAFDSSLLTVYGYLFGNYDVTIFDTSISPSLSKFLISIFLFFVVIVLLNLLIALMGDIFDEVQAKSQSESTYGKAKLIVEYESLFSEGYKKRNEKEFYPVWLHVLKKGKEVDNEKEEVGWKGRTEEIRKEIMKLEAQNLNLEVQNAELKEQNKLIICMLDKIVKK